VARTALDAGKDHPVTLQHSDGRGYSAIKTL
jgi:hypothetical protein